MAETQEYSPLSTQPYQPNQVPDPAPPKPDPLQDKPAFQFQGHGNISHGGAIAGVFDNLMKGYVTGHAQSEAHKALLVKKKSDDLNQSYNQDAQRLYQLHAAGVDEKSPEYQAAKSAVDGSWGALQDFRGGLLEQHGGGKKKTKGKPSSGQDDSPLMALMNPGASAQEKAQAIYMMSRKMGAPVYGQIAALNTPQAQQARATQNTMGDADAAHATNTLTREQAQATYNKLAGKPEEQMTPEEKQQLSNARAVLNPPTNKGTTREYMSPDGKTKDWFVPGSQPEGYTATASSGTTKLYKSKDGTQEWYRPGEEPEGATAVGSAAAKVGSFGDFMTAAYGDKPTPDDYVKGRALWAKSGAGTTTGEHVVMVPQRDGSIVPITVQTTSTKTFPGGGNAPTTRQDTPPANPPTVVTPSFHGKTIPGMVAKGNVDVANRPNIDNGDGTHSSVFSMSFGTDKGEVLVPGVGDGTTYPLRRLTNDEALDQYKKTGKNLGTFKDAKAANAYAETLHKDQAKQGKSPTPPNTTRREKPARPSGGVVAVGAPVGARVTPNQTKADEDVTAAVKLNSLAVQVLHSNEPGMQRQLALALIKGMAGRVNMQEYSIYTHNYGFANTIEGLQQMVKSGRLPKEVVRQLALDAHANLVASKAAQSEAYRPPPTNSASASSKGVVVIDDAMKLAKYKGRSREEVSAAITAQGYTPQ